MAEARIEDEPERHETFGSAQSKCPGRRIQKRNALPTATESIPLNTPPNLMLKLRAWRTLGPASAFIPLAGDLGTCAKGQARGQAATTPLSSIVLLPQQSTTLSTQLLRARPPAKTTGMWRCSMVAGANVITCSALRPMTIPSDLLQTALTCRLVQAGFIVRQNVGIALSLAQERCATELMANTQSRPGPMEWIARTQSSVIQSQAQ
jgi:hypothetical protein